MRIVATTALMAGLGGAALLIAPAQAGAPAPHATSINSAVIQRIAAQAVADAEAEIAFEDALISYRSDDDVIIHADRELTPEEEARIRARVDAAMQRVEGMRERITQRALNHTQHHRLTEEQRERIRAHAHRAAEQARVHAHRAQSGRYVIQSGRELTPEEEARIERQVEAAMARVEAETERVAEVMARVAERLAEIDTRHVETHAELTAEQEARIEEALERAEEAIERAAESVERAQEGRDRHRDRHRERNRDRDDRLEGGRD